MKTTAQKIIALLPASRLELMTKLDLSSTAITKQLANLRAKGYEIITIGKAGKWVYDIKKSESGSAALWIVFLLFLGACLWMIVIYPTLPHIGG